MCEPAQSYDSPYPFPGPHVRWARTPTTSRDCSCLICYLLTAYLLKHSIFTQRQAQGLPTAAQSWCASQATLSLSTSFCRRVGELPREIYAELVSGDALPTLTRLPGSVCHALARCLALLCVSARLLVWQACPLDLIVRAVCMLVRPAMVRSNRTATHVSKAAGSSSELDVDRARCSCFVCSRTSVCARRGSPSSDPYPPPPTCY